MNSGKIVAGGRVDETEIEGSIRGPRGPKKSSKVKNYFGGFFAYKLQAHSPFPSVTGYPQIGRGK